ncbi:N-acetylglucosamine kinase [Nonomuraea glycinis]|uniref:N-acetylglucosamine kinase n=1 Tax=Nonomuraea glycinis TaxID=2047744 RepID=UPI002E0EA705|nr:ATPase [Nonomuraea glycinis]
MGGELVAARRLLLAVDGGNSKTDVAVVAEDGGVLATGRAGPFRPQSTGVAAAVTVVEQALAAARPEAVVERALTAAHLEVGVEGVLPGVRPGGVGFDHVAAFLAGADLPVEEEALAREFAARGFGADVVVRNDVFALLRAGASGPAGVAVVCGAGINAVGASPTGQVARFPALGRLSGDWGGGEGLGEEALWHAIRAEDGRGPATALAELVTAHFGAATVEQVVLALHFGELDMDRLHELAPGVFAAAEAGDEVAGSLVDRLAEEVVVLAEVCLRRLGLLDTPAQVVLGGGILTAGHRRLTGRLEAAFAIRAPKAELVVASLAPIAGAALSGLDHLGATPAAKARLRAHYDLGTSR